MSIARVRPCGLGALAAGLHCSSTTVWAGRGGERKQASTPRGDKRDRQATGFCRASHDGFALRIALLSMTLHYMTVLHDAYFRRSGEGYSLACPGESARPRVFVSFRADLAFAVSCLESCAPLPGNDVSFLLTLPCAASPCFASRHGTSRSGMSGMFRPATVPNAAPVFGRSRSSGLSSGRLH